MGLKINDQATNYTITNNQILTSSTSTTPIPTYYLWYRKRCPEFTGESYSASASYSENDQVLFTSTDGTQDFWEAVAATVAGQSPDTNPDLWEKLDIPYAFLDYCVYSSFADWLMVEGQAGKASAMSQYADTLLTRELERQELQMGVMQPTRYTTHVTSQAYY